MRRSGSRYRCSNSNSTPHLITIGAKAGQKLREEQIQGIERIKHSSKKFIGLRAPTGIGKSILAMHALKPPLVYLCSSRYLQNQLMRDFPDAALLQGRSNYGCRRGRFPDAEVCNLREKCEDCAYEEAKRRAMNADYAILNYHYFLFASNYAGFMQGKQKNIVIDEADEMEKILTDFVSFEFTQEQLQWMGLRVPLPRYKTKLEAGVQWLEKLNRQAQRLKEQYQEAVDGLDEDEEVDRQEIQMMKKLKGLERLCKKLQFLLKQNMTAEHWVYHHDGKRIQVALRWLTRELVDMFLMQYGKKVLMMSATLQAKPVLCGLLALKPDELDYIELPSPFPVHKRPVIVMPRYRLSRNRELPKKAIRAAVKDILNRHKDERGIIHCVSYKLGKVLTGLSKRLIFHHDKSKNTALEEYLHIPDAVLVSPSCMRGLDLIGDKGRFVIFLKCPFLDLSDPLTNARAYGAGKWGRLWYKAEAVQSLIQGSGRVVRDVSDWGTVYMLDENIYVLMSKNANLFPQWYRDAVEMRE